MIATEMRMADRKVNGKDAAVYRVRKDSSDPSRWSIYRVYTPKVIKGKAKKRVTKPIDETSPIMKKQRAQRGKIRLTEEQLENSKSEGQTKALQKKMNAQIKGLAALQKAQQKYEEAVRRPDNAIDYAAEATEKEVPVSLKKITVDSAIAKLNAENRKNMPLAQDFYETKGDEDAAVTTKRNKGKGILAPREVRRLKAQIKKEQAELKAKQKAQVFQNKTILRKGKTKKKVDVTSKGLVIERTSANNDYDLVKIKSFREPRWFIQSKTDPSVVHSQDNNVDGYKQKWRAKKKADAFSALIARGRSLKKADPVAEEKAADNIVERISPKTSALSQKGDNYFKFSDGTILRGANSGEIYNKANGKQKQEMEHDIAEEGFYVKDKPVPRAVLIAKGLLKDQKGSITLREGERGGTTVTGKANMAKKTVDKVVAYANNSVLGAISITRKFRGWGENTGFAIKRYHSVIEFEQEMAKKRIREVVKTFHRAIKIGGKKYTSKQKRELLGHATLMAEDDVYAGKLMQSDPKTAILLSDTAILIRDFFKEAQQWANDNNLGGFDFVENARTRIKKEIQEAKDEQPAAANRKDHARGIELVEKINELQNKLHEMRGMHFVHIPIASWFPSVSKQKKGQRQSGKARIRASQITETLKATEKRFALSIARMLGMKNLKLELADVDPIQIMMSYADRRGQAHALMNIRDGAVADGLAIKQTKKPSSAGNKYWERGGAKTVFKDHWIDSRVIDNVSELNNSMKDESILWRYWIKAVSQTKMMQFYNPVFMPMYDLYQSLFKARGILHLPTWGKNLGKAMYQTYTKGDVWQEAAKLNTFSKPHANPMANRKRLEQKLRNSRTNGVAKVGLQILDVARGLAGFNGRGATMITEAYNISWDLAWSMDQAIRLTTYQTNKDIGMSKANAADLAARVHADYADVPAKLRKTLNKIIFTPTYFLSMLKVQTAMVTETAKWAMNLPTGGHFKQTETDSALVLGAMVSAGALWAINSMNVAAGYEEEEWGRKWVKQVGDTGEEITLNMTNPLNKNIKYLYWLKGMVDPGELNPANAVWQRAKWEATPLYRIGLMALDNRKGNGKQIRKSFDDWDKQWMDTIKWSLRETIGMLNYYDKAMSIWKDEPTLFKETNPELRRALANDVNTLYTGLEAMGLAFVGHRKSKERRTVAKINNLVRTLRKEIVNDYVDTGEYNEEQADRWEKKLYERVEKLEKELEE
jgi:hypothetical protein